VTGIAKQTDLCRVCGNAPVSSKEHLPPKRAGNRGKMRIAFIDAAAPTTEAEVRERVTQNGFWVPRLCARCNSFVGGEYVEAYGQFVDQFGQSGRLEESSGRIFVVLEGIHPSRVLKQAFVMFLAAAPWSPHPKWQPLRDYVLDPTSPLPQDAPSVYAYMNVSGFGRVIPACGIVEFATHKVLCVAEVSWPPVGLVFSYQDDERLDQMADLSRWGQMGPSDQLDATIALPQLEVTSHFPLAFGTSEEILEEERRRLPAYLFHVPPGSHSPTDIGVLLARHRPT